MARLKNSLQFLFLFIQADGGDFKFLFIQLMMQFQRSVPVPEPGGQEQDKEDGCNSADGICTDNTVAQGYTCREQTIFLFHLLRLVTYMRGYGFANGFLMNYRVDNHIIAGEQFFCSFHPVGTVVAVEQ